MDARLAFPSPNSPGRSGRLSQRRSRRLVGSSGPGLMAAAGARLRSSDMRIDAFAPWAGLMVRGRRVWRWRSLHWRREPPRRGPSHYVELSCTIPNARTPIPNAAVSGATTTGQ
jgi:hypothetical protein